MPFRLTNAGEYAVRLMTYLAGQPTDKIVSAKEVAAAQDIPHKFLQTIVSQFVKLGYPQSFKGVNGGINLAPEARKITLLQVIEAVEGPIALNVCMLGQGYCQYIGACSVHQVWHRAQQAMLDVLQEQTIDELANANAIMADHLRSHNKKTVLCGIEPTGLEEATPV